MLTNSPCTVKHKNFPPPKEVFFINYMTEGTGALRKYQEFANTGE